MMVVMCMMMVTSMMMAMSMMMVLCMMLTMAGVRVQGRLPLLVLHLLQVQTLN